MFEQVPDWNPPKPYAGSVAEAVTRVVVGQMLSRKAARAIYARVESIRDQLSLNGSWQIDHSQLRSAGLSNSKVRAIREFGERYDEDPGLYETWRSLDHVVLTEQVRANWGMGYWTADILGLFYFGNPDIFPNQDGTIKNALKLLDPKDVLDVNRAKPFRSYLARCLWYLYDNDLLKN